MKYSETIQAMAEESKVPFDDAPKFVGACLLPIIVSFLKLWKNRFGRIYLMTSVIGFPAALLLTFLAEGEVGRWFVLGLIGLVLFGFLFFVVIFQTLLIFFFVLAPIGLAISAIILFGYEAYGFLRNGAWDLHTPLNHDPIYDWVTDRQDWVGLKKLVQPVLDYMPLWALMLFASVAIGTSEELETTCAKSRREYLKLRDASKIRS